MLTICYSAVVLLAMCGLSRRLDYMSREVTNAVKGIFIIFVFISHANQYILLDNQIGGWLGQLVVVMFLFYSGYGVTEGWRHKGLRYVFDMPRNRILFTWVNFAFAVLVFCICLTVMNRPPSWKSIVYALIAWDSVGNSNWYIFVILICYSSAFVSFIVAEWTRARNRLIVAELILMAELLCAMLLLSIVKSSWWYDTMLVFGFGSFFSVVRKRFDQIVERHYAVCAIVVILAFFVFRGCPLFVRGVIPNLTGCLFALVVLLFLKKCPLASPLLGWFGLNLFPLYIYQRIPMLLISMAWPHFVAAHPTVFLFVSAVVTVLIALVYPFMRVRL